MNAFNLDPLDPTGACGRDPEECKRHFDWDFADVTKLACRFCGRKWQLPYDPTKPVP